MNIRAQNAMVFHLDKCIGCHTCSIACKNIWTEREGAEYMWWNNVETKPGTGYPTLWENQKEYGGGFEINGNGLKLKSGGKFKGLLNIFYNPKLPTMDDYYEPFTYQYENLFMAKEGVDQPTARSISMVTGKPMEINAGPNWDDDLGGSTIYAKNDPNLSSLNKDEAKGLFEIERVLFFYLPRICNHCLNPACVAACPSGAIYKRGEDGVVLINQDVCRGWRFCVSSCPYKKPYYNWASGKSEKCILCYPRVETGQAPACMHSCVGRIRYFGTLLYDADRIVESQLKKDAELVNSLRDIILDPYDPRVLEDARRCGVSDGIITSAQNSPVYKYLKVYKLALPLHPEFRTLPMLFYVPPMLPVIAQLNNNNYDYSSDEFFTTIDKLRIPVKYLANLFSGGNEGHIRYSLKKQFAVRTYRREKTAGDVDKERLNKILAEADLSAIEAEEIYRLTSLASFEGRFAIPPLNREVSIECTENPFVARGEGVGLMKNSKRGL